MENLSPSRRQILTDAPAAFSKIVGFYNFQVLVHGVPLHFHLSSPELVKKLKNYFPKKWQRTSQNAFHIYWKSPEAILGASVEDWSNISDPNCQFIFDWVSQRDFLVKRVDDIKIYLVATEELDDGFFNFLRYFLPLELLKQNKILFHSSCVVDDMEDAYLFFGHSGAGKTTISQLCWEGRVLGDDMNLLTIEEDIVLVEPAVVGQRFYNKDNFGKKFLLDKAFWLEKSKEIKAESMVEKRRNRLLSSFTGLFWDQLTPENYQKVFQLASVLNRELELYELHFNLTQEVWDYVRKIDESI